MKTILLLILTAMLVCCSGAGARTIFFDDFEDGVIGPKWSFYGKWEEKEGTLACADSEAKFNYAIPEIAALYNSEPLTIQTKGMIVGNPWTRMGVGIRLTKRDGAEAQDGKPSGYIGYNLCTSENGPSDVKLLNEGVLWLNLFKPLRPEKEQWVWIQLTVDEKEKLLAKVWKDGEDEPDDPTGEAKDWPKAGAIIKPNRPTGFTGLVGKAMEAWGRGGATPVYDEIEIWDKDGPSEVKIAVSPAGRLTSTWARVKNQ